MSESAEMRPLSGGQEPYYSDNSAIPNHGRERSLSLHGPNGTTLTEVDHESPNGVKFFHEHIYKEPERHGSLLSKELPSGEVVPRKVIILGVECNEVERSYSMASDEGDQPTIDEELTTPTLETLDDDDHATTDEELENQGLRKTLQNNIPETLDDDNPIDNPKTTLSFVKEKVSSAFKGFCSGVKSMPSQMKTLLDSARGVTPTKLSIRLLNSESKEIKFDEGAFYNKSEDSIRQMGGTILTKNLSKDSNKYEGIVLDKEGMLHFLYDPKTIKIENKSDSQDTVLSTSYKLESEGGDVSTPHDQLNEAFGELARIGKAPKGFVAYKGMVVVKDTVDQYGDRKIDREERGSVTSCKRWVKEYLQNVDPKSFNKLHEDTKKVFNAFRNLKVSEKSSQFAGKSRMEIKLSGGRCLVDLKTGGSSFEGVVLDRNKKLHFIISHNKLDDIPGSQIQKLYSGAMKALIGEDTLPTEIVVVRKKEIGYDMKTGEVNDDPLYLGLIGIQNKSP